MQKIIYRFYTSSAVGLITIFILGAFFAFSGYVLAALTDGMDASYLIGAESGTQDFDTATASTGTDGFQAVTGIELDTVNNRLFVADQVTHRVLVFNVDPTTKLPLDYTADNVLGQENFTGSSSATDADGLSAPIMLAYDPDNQFLFVSDRNNNRVVVYDVTSITDGEDALYVYGQANLTSVSANRGGSAAQNSLSTPDGIELDSTNDLLYVSDRANNRVMVWDTSDIAVGDNGNADYVLGQADFTSSSSNRGGSVAANTLSAPGGILADPANNLLYVGESSNFATSNNRILIYDVSTITNGEAAVNVLGQADFTSNSGTASASASRVGPIITDFALDSTNDRLFVTDPAFNRVIVYDVTTITDGEDAVNVLGRADLTTGSFPELGTTSQSTFNGPGSLEYDSGTGVLFVGDAINYRVMIFEASASTPGTITYSGTFTEDEDTGSLSGSRIATIVDDTFVNSGSTLTLDTHYSLTNAPAGLTPVMTVNGAGTTATLTFTGNATDHATEQNTSITITFLDGAFTNTATASDATGYTNTAGTVTFSDTPDVGGGYAYGCKDKAANNYKRFVKHDQDLCEYDTGLPAVEETLGSGQCSADLIVTENMKQGDRDGNTSSYNNGTITQVALLQAHINRILAAQYDEAAGPVDGIFGPLTKKGVERLQAALQDSINADLGVAGIDGIVGPFTRNAINNSCS